LWDQAQKQVMRCFIVPRGVTILAGGTVEEHATSLNLEATIGSSVYGKYLLNITILSDDRFSYEEDTQLLIKGKKEIFHHIDKNTLTRTINL